MQAFWTVMWEGYIQSRAVSKAEVQHLEKREENTEHKVAQTNYIAVHNFKMDRGVWDLAFVSLSMWPQLIRAPIHPTGLNQPLGAAGTCRSRKLLPSNLDLGAQDNKQGTTAWSQP